MKPLLLVLVGLIATTSAACGGALTEVYEGALVSGITSAANPDDVGGVSESYLIRVTEGIEHYVYPNGPDGNIAGIWNANANDFMIQANPEMESRTVTYTFSEGGFQEVFLRSMDSDISSPYTFKIWVP